jgi:aspartyl-tRNA(Asn)/glutamyl-tRNA(Gln) amidotransferase subunit C
MSEPKISMLDLEYIAKLARIKLSESEKNIFLPQLESVLEYLDVLNQANVENIEPTFRVNDQKNVLRSDEVIESFNQKIALSSSLKTQDGYFVVPGTIKK